MSQLDLVTIVNAPPAVVFDNWMDPIKCAILLDAPVTIEPWVGGQYTLWDGEVFGEFVAIQKHKLLAMTWATKEFTQSEGYSRLEMTFNANPQGTLVRVVQDQIPSRVKAQFQMAWEQVVFPTMRERLKMLL